MTKITMPDPVAHIVMAGGRIYEVYDDEDTAQKVASCLDGYTATVIPLISTTQAEAYANSILAPTSKALEVAQVALERICAIDRVGGCESIAMDALSDIRALIPKEQT